MADKRPIRHYNCADQKMLITVLVVITHFLDHIDRFLTARTDFANPFAANLKTRVGEAENTHLSNTGNQGPRPSTAELTTLKEVARSKVSLLKNTLNTRFKKLPLELNKYNSALGLSLHYDKFYSGSDSAAAELFKKMEAAFAGPLKAELVGKGLAVGMLDEALASLEPIKPLDVSQTVEGSQTMSITDAGINEFNAIFDTAMDICDQGKSLFKDEPAIREKFIWDNLL